MSHQVWGAKVPGTYVAVCKLPLVFTKVDKIEKKIIRNLRKLQKSLVV